MAAVDSWCADEVYRGRSLDAYQVAYLNGGDRHVNATALLELMRVESVVLEHGLCHARGAPPRDEVERSLWEHIRVRPSLLTNLGADRYPKLRETLTTLELLQPAGARRRGLIKLGAALLGLGSLGTCLLHHQANGWLVMLIPTMIVLPVMGFLLPPAFRTRKGEQLLHGLRVRHQDLGEWSETQAPEGMPMAFALFGADALVGGPFGPLGGALRSICDERAPNECGNGCGD